MAKSRLGDSASREAVEQRQAWRRIVWLSFKRGQSQSKQTSVEYVAG